jgi:DNA processing protein
MNDELESLYLYILSKLPIKGFRLIESWLLKAGSFKKIFFASAEELAEFGMPTKLIIKLQKIKKEVAYGVTNAETLFKRLESSGVQVLPYYSSEYPKLLKEINDPPLVLFYRGEIFKPEENCIAIVGSRKMSSYGASAMPRITKPLLDAGITIVSGLAYGVDSEAHSLAVASNSRTIAVLGSGVDDDSIYPRAHLRLARKILDCGGLIVSEYPPGTPGLKQNFVERNRIIAGLSLGVVIIECKIKSGALHTADFASDYNRNLFALPGPVYSALSEGPHKLIQNGAMLVTSGSEIIEDLNLSSLQNTETLTPSFSYNERLVLECMQIGPANIDKIATSTKLSASTIAMTITGLELKNIITNVGIEGFAKI